MRSTENKRSFRFSKRYRLTLQRDFRTVFRRGQRLDSEHAIVYTHENDLGHGRLGIVVRRKIGNAAQRNRMKRLIREWFRHEGREHPLDVVVLPKPAFANLRSARDVANYMETIPC